MSRQEALSETRNAWYREASRGAIGSITKLLHERFSSLAADHITVAGVAGVALGATLAEIQNRQSDEAFLKKTPTLAILGFASLLDVFDGAMARLVAEENSDKALPHGQIVDVVADRIQEAVLATSRAVSANKRDDKTGEIFAYISEISNVAPSLLRAISEARGMTVPEGGRNAIGLLGTRVGRSISGIISTVFPEVKGITVQKILDIVNITANALTTYDRAQIALNSVEGGRSLNFDTRKNAVNRVKVLSGVAGVTIVAAVGTYKVLRK